VPSSSAIGAVDATGVSVVEVGTADGAGPDDGGELFFLAPGEHRRLGWIDPPLPAKSG
jgi:hypothetical protein